MSNNITIQCSEAELYMYFETVQSLLADEQLASCPVLLLGNKIDIPGAASEDYIRQYFGLYGLTTGKVLHVCSIIYKH